MVEKLLPREQVQAHIEKALSALTPAERFVVLEFFRVRQGKPPRGVVRARLRRRSCFQKFMNAYLSG
jgi:hypothetical protein